MHPADDLLWERHLVGCFDELDQSLTILRTIHLFLMKALTK
jgi:hypothetical protein